MTAADEAKAVRVAVGSGLSVSARWSPSARQAWAFVYAPGAGSSLDDPFGRFLASLLPEAGVSLLRFQFPYMEAGRPAPDRNDVLEATWRGALELARGEAGHVIAGGRSMGGRIASQVVAQREPVDALALFAYPLHPPKRPEARRDAHLASLAVPVLFCSGDRDPYASPVELQELVALVPRACLELLTGADHGFAPLKSSGRTRGDVWRQAAKALTAFGDGVVTEVRRDRP